MTSWVIVEKETGKVVFETFSETVSAAIRETSKGYEAIPIMEYLTSLNKEIKDNA